jgi:hypothetical protein
VSKAGPVEQADNKQQWTNMFSSFTTVYYKWDIPEGNLSAAAQTKKRELVNRLRSLINNRNTGHSELSKESELTLTMINLEVDELFRKIRIECAPTPFLSKLNEPLFAYAVDLALDIFPDGVTSPPGKKLREIIHKRVSFLFHRTCMKLETLAVNHYFGIWSSLSKEEQRTIYDIALDELVNPANRKTARRLAEMGLAKPIDFLACYNVMNISFRSYVLSHVANNEITVFKEEIAAKGFMRSIQLPAMIIVIAVLVFIFSTQREGFMHFVSYLTAIAAAVGGLTKIISSIPDSKG